jgi:hypothetical protein
MRFQRPATCIIMSSQTLPNRLLASATAAVLAALALSGCGAEVAGAAATVGAMQADQARQAQAQRTQVVDGFRSAQDAGVARAASAAD